MFASASVSAAILFFLIVGCRSQAFSSFTWALFSDAGCSDFYAGYTTTTGCLYDSIEYHAYMFVSCPDPQQVSQDPVITRYACGLGLYSPGGLSDDAVEALEEPYCTERNTTAAPPSGCLPVETLHYGSCLPYSSTGSVPLFQLAFCGYGVPSYPAGASVLLYRNSSTCSATTDVPLAVGYSNRACLLNRSVISNCANVTNPSSAGSGQVSFFTDALCANSSAIPTLGVTASSCQADPALSGSFVQLACGVLGGFSGCAHLTASMGLSLSLLGLALARSLAL